MAVSKRLRYEILRRDNHACRYCGAMAPEAKLTVDHVIPVALGGSDDPSNLVTACFGCNSGKSSSNPDQPLVADVSADALAWREAVDLAVLSIEADQDWTDMVNSEFEGAWLSWHWGGKPENRIPLPPTWRRSLLAFRAAGLTPLMILELVPVAMTSNVKIDQTWRYFCGCCWRQADEIRERAALIHAENQSRI